MNKMNDQEKKERHIEILSKPGAILKSQIILLNELSIKLFKEKDEAKKEVIRADLHAISEATNSMIGE